MNLPSVGCVSRSLASYSRSAACVREEALQASEQFIRDGLLQVRGAVDVELAQALESHIQSELSLRQCDGDQRWFGNVYGYEDKGKRWDLKLLLNPAVCNALENLLNNLQPMIESLYKCRLKLSELAAMCTLPGDIAQPVHADTSHMDEHGVVTVFVALHEIKEQRGPTCMYPGTHTDSGLHMGLKTLDESSGLLCTMQCGDCMVMDSRLLHRGTANISEHHRYLFYCSWMPEFGTSRSSTNTILDAYRDRLLLSKWREWIQEPPEVEMLAVKCEPSIEGNAATLKSENAGSSLRRGGAILSGHREKRRKFWRGAQMCRPDWRIEQRKLEKFLAWLCSYGLNLKEKGVEIRHSPTHGFGVFCLKRIHPGETLVRIPMAAVLHCGKIHKTVFAQRVLEIVGPPGSNNNTAITPEELLWLYMIWGCDEPELCPWYGYLQSLPASDPNSWSMDEKAFRWLKGTPVAESTIHELNHQKIRHESIVGKLVEACPHNFSMTRFSFAKWLWARSCYTSRAFQSRAFPNECVEPGWETDFLCPVLDIPNHRPQAEVELRFGVEFVALMLPLSAPAYDVGDEIYNLYGASLGNDVLLKHYGFCVTRNPHNLISELTIELPSGSVNSSLEKLSCAAIPGLLATPRKSAICLKIPQPLSCGMLEIPSDVLRATSLVLLGSDYDQELASCSEKSETSKNLAKSLRRMLADIVPLSWFAKNAEQIVRRPCLPPKSSVEHSAAVYAWGYRRILHAAIACAEGEAEMAALAAQMDNRESAENKLEEHSVGDNIGENCCSEDNDEV